MMNTFGTIGSPEQVVAAWASAYKSHDAAAAAALYHDDATNFQAAWGQSSQGRPAMLQTFTKTLQAFPDIHLDIEKVIGDGEWVVIEWRFSGTMRGEFAGHPPTGRRFDLRGCKIFQIREGRILIQHGYWDKATMFAQLGLS